MIRLIERLRALGNAPAVDLMSSGRTLESFRSRPAIQCPESETH